MRRQLRRQLLAIGIMLLCLMPFRASAGAATGIYVFGDSLSDPGNVFQTSLLAVGTGLPAPPYFEGRFSNGYLWVDYLSKQLGFQLTPATEVSPEAAVHAVSFAYGGATTGTDNTVDAALPGLQQEVEQFQQFVTQTKLDPNALYALWIGANDYLPDGSLSNSKAAPHAAQQPAEAIRNIAAAIQALYGLGARHFLVTNLPALGATPLAQTLSSEVALSLNQLTQRHNQALNRELDRLQQQLPQLQLIRLDVNQLFQQAVAGKLGFTDVKRPCLDRSTGQVCANPDQHLFWDALHPTTAAHRYIATAAATTISAQWRSAPQISSFSGLMLLGMLSLIAGVGAGWRNRRLG